MSVWTWVLVLLAIGLVCWTIVLQTMTMWSLKNRIERLERRAQESERP